MKKEIGKVTVINILLFDDLTEVKTELYIPVKEL